MRPKHLRELIQDMIKDPLHNPPLYVQGPPGVGKSRVISGVATDEQIGFVDNRPCLRDPTDYRGIPTVSGENALWLAPADLPTDHFCLDCGRVLHVNTMEVSNPKKLENGRWEGVKCKFCGSQKITWRGIINYDELSSAPPMTQAGVYSLFLDRKLGEYSVPEGWYQIAAGNRTIDRAVVHPMSTALKNRFIHVEYEYNVDDWIDWSLNSGNMNPNIISFIKWRPEALFKFDPASSDFAFPSPRTWEFASRALNVVQKREILVQVLEGTVGKGATAEFVAFLKVQQELPDLMPILNGTSKYVPPQNRMDLKYAIVCALATKANPKSSHFENLLKYSINLPEEFGVLMIQMLVLRNKEAVGLCPSFPAWAQNHVDTVLSKKMGGGN
jgi:hypothetical protein